MKIIKELELKDNNIIYFKKKVYETFKMDQEFSNIIIHKLMSWIVVLWNNK